MGGCEINLADEYTSMSNPGGLGLFHLNKRVSISFPKKYRWGSELSPGVDLESYSVSIGFPLTIKDRHFGLGIAYSNIKSDSYRKDYVYSYPFAYIEKSDYYTVAAAYYNKVRIGLGYTLKQIDSWFNVRWAPNEKYNEDKSSAYDVGIFFDVPLRNSTSLKNFFSGIDKDNIKHNIIPSIAYIRSNMGGDFRREYLVFGNRPLPEISKYGFSILFVSNYNEAEIFSFRIIHEINNTLKEDDVNFRKFGFEVGAGGTIYMRAGFWSANTIDEKIRTYGFGFNLGGLANILYATGKINTVNPVARYILKNISISADFAMERCNDESVYEDSDYFKICFSL